MLLPAAAAIAPKSVFFRELPAISLTSIILYPLVYNPKAPISRIEGLRYLPQKALPAAVVPGQSVGPARPARPMRWSASSAARPPHRGGQAAIFPFSSSPRFLFC